MRRGRIAMESAELIRRLYESIGEACVTSPDIAHVEIHGNRVVGRHLVPGLKVEAEEAEDGVSAHIRVTRGTQIAEPVRICFGILPEQGIQRVRIRTDLEEGARAAVMASCTFPNAVDVLHEMEAETNIGPGAEYVYLERHVHSPAGGLRVVPHARIDLAEGARFRTDFELLKGRVGQMEIRYRATVAAGAVLEMSARVSGRGDDRIAIEEQADLVGERARAVLTTNIAVREKARAEVKNVLRAKAAYARGHIDCKEIVREQGYAEAIPVVEVEHPQAHVTHEAAIGSVDAKQLETLMARGLDEEAATDLIIEGLLSPTHPSST
ncbi:MAG: SufBD protein [Candidatus Eisenbacteria bacterium]|nr:SufBD protein [Candidatus Eisenbacteria bacterium]